MDRASADQQPVLRLRPEGKIIRRESVALWADAQAVLADAQRRADELLGEARLGVAEERMRGYAAGMREARYEQAQIMVDAVMRRDAYLAAIEEHLVGVVLSAMRKITSEFDELARTRIAVTNALAALRNLTVATIRVNPAHVDELRALKDRLFHICPYLRVLEIESDPRLESGACMLISDLGQIETDLESQIRAVEHAVARVGVPVQAAGITEPRP